MTNFTECYITFTFRTHTFKATVRSWQALDDLINEFYSNEERPFYESSLVSVDLTPLLGRTSRDGESVCTDAGVWMVHTQNLTGRTLNGDKPALTWERKA